MHNNYRALFSQLNPLEPSDALLSAVLSEIKMRETRRTRIRSILSAGFFVLGLIAVVPAWRELNAELTQSGFFHFASLLFSDAETLLTYWKDFAGSLAESFPAFGMSAVLGSILALFVSLKFFIQNIHPTVRRPSRFAHL